MLTMPDWRGLIAARPALSMHARDGLLFEDVPLRAIAEQAGTPVWVYGAGTIRARQAALRAAFDSAGLGIAFRFAVKANDHRAILGLMRTGGLGADVTSAGELARALSAGIAPESIVFSGVGKTRAEIEMALARGIGQINVESAEELVMISAAAAGLGRTAPVAFRVNPDVDAASHAKITTGRAGDKFGIAHDEVAALYRHAAGLEGVSPLGLAVHIGSQILTLAPYEAAYRRMAALIGGLRAAGQEVARLDLGGGFGIPYRDEPGFPLEAYARMVRRVVGGLGLELIAEPGRYLVGPAGLLLASVTLIKQTRSRRFVVLDAGMNDLLRPALYDAFHGIVPVDAADAARAAEPCDVVGPVCETGDRFAEARDLPPLAPGALVALLDAGAYGAVMSSTYNSRPHAAQVLVDRGAFHLIRPRQRIEALWQDEIVPEGLD